MALVAAAGVLLLLAARWTAPRPRITLDDLLAPPAVLAPDAAGASVGTSPGSVEVAEASVEVAEASVEVAEASVGGVATDGSHPGAGRGVRRADHRTEAALGVALSVLASQ